MRGLAVALTLLAATGAAHAAGAVETAFGSYAFHSFRQCARPADVGCQSGSMPSIAVHSSDYGWSYEADTQYSTAAGSIGETRVDFGAYDLPNIGVYSSSASGQRSNNQIFALRELRNEGDEAIDLVLAAKVHFETSGQWTQQQTGLGFQNVEMAGEGWLSVYLQVWTPTVEPIPWWANGSFHFSPRSCGDSTVLGATVNQVTFGKTGEQNTDVGLASGCGGQALTLQPGESVFVLAGLVALTNRGGLLDALGTLDVGIDPVATVYTGTGQSVGVAGLNAALSGAPAPVPEPKTWALLIIGFGAVGAGLRTRKRASIGPSSVCGARCLP